MQEPKSVYVQKMVETIDYIDGKTALPFIEILERIDIEKLEPFIDMIYEEKDHLTEVLSAISAYEEPPDSSDPFLDSE